MLTYSPGKLQSEDKVLLDAFSNLKISTENITTHAIPGKIEAEEFIYNYGWVREDCSDEGAGYDMGYTDEGDFLDFRVDVTNGGRYKILYRVASGNSEGGKIDLEMVPENGEISLLHTFSVPPTSGWQNWTTLNREAYLPKGQYTIRLLVNKREFNINWMEFDLLEVTGTDEISVSDDFFRIYPNPAKSKLNIDFRKNSEERYFLKIMNVHGAIVKEENLKITNRAIIDLNGLAPGYYLLQVAGEEHIESKPFIISNK
ncbi:MAG: hypothetical protein A2W90_05125 [Bacteroidetes bacterium GWF2_42_66]|nr:MAG: hypothetical protein A2W92_03300 [Bacteroidetes bacterium GWA2_42_15]OFX95966.1 MAG: hypothetical protein A2W89_02535 [Bacteroidetes bacterium GWE2_42_39]OFY46539.1 MAG: hypothetical protein A2W90_05125 [Bacteroidetes bacterium GWF2_42_66]HBL75609.1 hypothetical protein [Prolixibacteraceae bacterium]HCR91019.1 hypothetical protein [Prolixibacteraceae bacterium]